MARRLWSTMLAGVILALLLGALGDSAVASTKVRGKVHACVINKGADKGLMRFSPSGKCKHGEKKLTWNKRGKRGKQGPEGATGVGGPETDQLSGTVNALCSQLSAVTAQLNSLRTAIAGLGLNGVLTALGGALTIPPLPPPMTAFNCS